MRHMHLRIPLRDRAPRGTRSSGLFRGAGRGALGLIVGAALSLVSVLGCSKSEPVGVRNQAQALRDAEADKAALQKEIAAYRADLEHERFLNRELKRRIKDLEEVQRIASLAKALPQVEAQTQKPAPSEASATTAHAAPLRELASSPTVATRPAAQPGPRVPPISAAIAVGGAASEAAAAPCEPQKPASVAALPQADVPAKSEPVPTTPPAKKEPPAPQPKKETAQREAPPQAALPRTEPAKPIEPTKVQDPPSAAKTSTATAKPKAEVKQASPPPEPEKVIAKAPGPVETKAAEGSTAAEAGQSASADLELLNLVNRRQGDKLKLSGEVRNNTSLPAQSVTVVVWLYDDRNAILQQVRLPVLGGSPLPAGQKAAFQTELPWDKRVSRCRFDVEGVQKVSVSRRD